MPTDTEARTREAATQVIEFVRLGYHDCSLNFTVHTGKAELVPFLLDAAGGYNNFDPDTVTAALADVLPSCMGVEFGRESSPVIYLEIPHWSHQQMGDESRGGKRLEREERHAILSLAVEALREAGADTVAVEYLSDQEQKRDYLRQGEKPKLPESGMGLKVRGWWD